MFTVTILLSDTTRDWCHQHKMQQQVLSFLWWHQQVIDLQVLVMETMAVLSGLGDCCYGSVAHIGLKDAHLHLRHNIRYTIVSRLLQMNFPVS